MLFLKNFFLGDYWLDCGDPTLHRLPVVSAIGGIAESAFLFLFLVTFIQFARRLLRNLIPFSFGMEQQHDFICFQYEQCVTFSRYCHFKSEFDCCLLTLIFLEGGSESPAVDLELESVME